MKSILCEKGQAYLITDRLTRKYFCGADIAEGFLLIVDGLTCFTDARYFSAAKTVLSEAGVSAKLYGGLSDIKNFLKEIGTEVLFADYSRTTVKEFEEYKSFGFPVKDCSEKFEKLRSVKTESELINIEKACAIAEKAYYAAIKSIKVGMTETELKEKIENLMVSFGAEGASFETIVAFGANAAVPHHETGNSVLTENVPVLVDTGCKVNGYCSDLTRTAFFGKPTEKFLKCYNAVLKANELAVENIRAGMTTDKADSIAREYLNENGLGGYFTHSLGHGVGLEIHEFPALSPRKSDELKDGTVFTIEPGVYIDGEFGVRIEDTVVLSDGKVKRLFTDDKGLLIIKK